MIRIYRRLFNDPAAPETEKKGDKEKRISKTRKLVAVFGNEMENEAIVACTEFRRLSESFSKTDSDERLSFQQYRYSLERDPEEKKPVQELADLQIDTSTAASTKRPIKFTWSWERTQNHTCNCMAWNERYGAIRGEVEDSVQGRTQFLLAVKKVWPNAVKIV